MQISKQSRFLLIILSVIFLNNALAAEGMQCMDALKAMKFAFQGVKKSNLTYSLKRDGETYYTLFVSAFDEREENKDGVAVMPWRLLERQGGSFTHCLIAAGKKVEELVDMHDASGPKNKYGMPGSGHQRCTDSSDGVFSSLGIRVWANKELGKSYIHHFTSEIGEYDFTLIYSIEGQGGRSDWILLSTKKGDPGSVCYYDRGDDIAIHPNFAIPPTMKFDVPQIEGIQ